MIVLMLSILNNKKTNVNSKEIRVIPIAYIYIYILVCSLIL